MGQCRTLDADVTIGVIMVIIVHVTTPFLCWNKLYPSHLFASYF